MVWWKGKHGGDGKLEGSQAKGMGCGMGGGWSPRGDGEEGEEGRGTPFFPSKVSAHLSAQLGWILSSQRGPWKPVAQKQEEVPALFTQVPPWRHGAGERRL